MIPNSESKAGITPIELARLIVTSCAWAGHSPARWVAGRKGTRDEAIAELRRSVAALSSLEETGSPSDTSNVWSQRRREIRHYLLSRDPSALLTWTPIVRSMTFGRLPWISAEFRALRHSGQWEARWRDALGENRAGLPMPSHVYPFSSGTLIHHAYHVHRFESATGRAIGDFTEIVEFGGGYGSMARLVARLGFRGRYHIHDLPEFSAVQRFYLRLVRSEIGEGEIADTLSRITFSPLREDASPSEDQEGGTLFLATWSLAETPIWLREEWRPTLARFRFFLIGFRDRFEDIDNLAWFKDLAATRLDMEWRFEPIRHRRENQYYLIGSPASGSGDCSL